jgi:hypothetical protein
MSTDESSYSLTEKDLFILTSRLDGKNFRQIAPFVSLTAESVRIRYNKILVKYPDLRKYPSSKIKDMVSVLQS